VIKILQGSVVTHRKTACSELDTYKERAEEDERYEIRNGHVVTTESDISERCLGVTLLPIHT